MEYETFLLIGAALLLVLDFFLLSSDSRSGKRRGQAGFCAAIVAFGMVLVSFSLLLKAFLGNDFSLIEVYTYSSSGLPFLSKVYASWGGARGSMLFLTFLLSAFYLILRGVTFKKTENFTVTTSKIFNLSLLVFVAVTLVKNPFERLALIPVEGRGLNPQLQTVWMAIHPPIVFLAYAFVVLAFTLTLASMRAGRELSDIRLLKISTYMGWLLLTLGIALGGVWAYEVLSWGGYWAWDPVETASLLPWVFLTAYFFVNQLTKNKRSLSKEFMILVTFSSLIFLSALTRGGFTSSVHSYAISPVGPIMLVFALAMISYFFYVRRQKKLPLFKLEIDRASLNSKASFVGFWALILIALVCLVGLAIPNFSYNSWTFPFVIIFVASLIGCSLSEKTRFARLLLLVIAALAVGGLAVLVFSSAINVLALLSLPILFLALSVTVYRLFKVMMQRAYSSLGKTLVYLGLVVLLLGVFVSAGAKSTNTVTDAKINTPVELSPVTLTINSVIVSNSSTMVYSEQLETTIPEYSSLKVDTSIQYLGRSFNGSLLANFYPNYGLVLRPWIVSTETGDVYIHLEYTEAVYKALTQALDGSGGGILENYSVTVQNSPLIYLLWIGIVLTMVGIILQFAADLADFSKRSK